MEFLTRFSPPGKYDKAPFKTIYRMSKDDTHWGYYLQTSTNAEEPEWIPMGYFFERAFESFLTHQEFIEECMRLYDLNARKPLASINKIIKEKTL